MHPVLFRIGGFAVYSYGLFVAMGFLAGMALAIREARRVALDPDKISDLFFWVIIAAIVGSRLLYVAVEIRSFLSAPLEIFKIWKGGLVFYGGLILAFMVIVFFIRRKQLPFWITMDVLAPSLAIGQVFGRMGCLFAGCCYGRPADLPWAVTFTDPDSLAPLYVPLHPTQLYEAGAVLLIFLVLMLVREVKRFEGQVMWTYVFLYSVARFVIENYRGDYRGMVWGDMLSTSQFISVFLAITALICFSVLWGKKGNK